MTKPIRPVLLLGLLIVTGVPLTAQQTEQEPSAGGVSRKTAIKDMTLEDLLKTVVTSASKLSQLTTDAPAAVALIPDYQIEGFGWNTVNSVLYHQPGFAPSQDYDRRTVASRGVFEGWNNNHLLLLVDGVPFNDDLYGTAYTWDTTPLFFTKSLEILRGPGSALYGSNAMNGAVSLKTVSASDLNDLTVARVRFGDFGTRQYDAITGITRESVSVVAGYSGFRTNGNEYRSLDGSRRTDEAGGLAAFRTHDSRTTDYALVKLEGKQRLSGWSLQLHWQDWKFGTDQGWLFYIPDFKEAMHESRTIVALSYKHRDRSDRDHEYVIRYQGHQISWNQRYFPNAAVDPYGHLYPAGLWEFLDTSASDFFSRAQISFPTRGGASLITGVETTRFFYDGDREHFSNVNINNGEDFSPVAGNVMKHLRPWLEWIKGNPVWNVGAYAQFVSGSLLGNKATATLGLRYDRQFFDLNAIDRPGAGKESKSFSQFSPRLAVVFHANEALTIKALAGRAFRAPSPTELFGANTRSLASNPRQLQPETVTSFELAGDWRIYDDVLLRLNLFDNKFENQIAYSVANANLSTNIYSLKSLGAETEVLVGTASDSAFFNYSYVRRLDERILDPTIAVSRRTMTWYPGNVANIGYLRNRGRWESSLSAHYQGEVNRRASDNFDPQFLPYRPSSVKSWTSLDTNVTFHPSPKFGLTFQGTNLLDRTNNLIKVNDFPFDYRTEGRRLSLLSTLSL
ncbi:MAG TPA: TonB-dependent receptor [Thermoanaerobaculia bacterium]|nr:TonB-dependent receptor [Thermoanaerobaculia bacterium]